MQDGDVSLSSHDDGFGNIKVIATPPHETSTIAPLMQDNDESLSSHDDVFGNIKVIATPPHETCTPSTIAPLMEDDDESLSSHDDCFANIKVIATPLHETCTPSTIAPLMQDADGFLSSHDDGFANNKVVATPLHETFTPSTKRVSFGPFVGVQELISRTNYTYEELKKTWYDTDDIRCMREIAKTEAKLVDSGHLVESKENSVRGLEQRTKKGSKEKKEIRMNSFAAVFLEIDFQRAESLIDDEAIADAYFKYSMPSAMTAQRLGRRDEIEARRCWRSPTHGHQKERMRGVQRESSRRSRNSIRSRRSIRELHNA